MASVAISSQSTSPPPAIGNPAGPPISWLRSIASANERVPTRLASGLACLLLTLMIYLELRSARGVPPIPVYYLLPIALLAWFAGWRSAFLAATAAFAVTLALVFLGRTHASGSATVFLARLLTFAVGAMIARSVSTARLMLDFVHRGAAWRAMRRPVRVGARLLVVPVLEDEVQGETTEFGPDVLPLYIEPGMAFGTSSHPTTRMCLQLLERYVRPGVTVLDLGSGTGILAIAAVKLGAVHVHAIDIDSEAIRVASRNLAHNHASDEVTLHHGSLDSIDPDGTRGLSDFSLNSSSSTLPSTRNQFGLIVANLLAGVIRELLYDGLPEVLASDAVLIASGIRSSELESIQADFLATGLHLDQSVEEDGWCALAARWQEPAHPQDSQECGSA